ncbi:hypothetical protein RB213_014112 [Colletotrichum asianum]
MTYVCQPKAPIYTHMQRGPSGPLEATHGNLASHIFSSPCESLNVPDNLYFTTLHISESSDKIGDEVYERGMLTAYTDYKRRHKMREAEAKTEPVKGYSKIRRIKCSVIAFAREAVSRLRSFSDAMLFLDDSPTTANKSTSWWRLQGLRGIDPPTSESGAGSKGGRRGEIIGTAR